MKLAGKTDVGRVRQENQDDYRAGELPGGAVWALVCDGMGGAKGGREASQGACNVIEQVFQEQYAQCGAGQASCPAARHGVWCVTVWAARAADGKLPTARATSSSIAFRSSIPSVCPARSLCF